LKLCKASFFVKIALKMRDLARRSSSSKKIEKILLVFAVTAVAYSFFTLCGGRIVFKPWLEKSSVIQQKQSFDQS
jgi:hypothetical protein